MRIYTQGIFLGVDGGGTKTIAVAADSHGNVHGVGFGGPVNIGWVGPEVAAESTRTAVMHAMAAAGVSSSDIVYAYLGMAGVNSDHAEDPERLVFMETLQRLGIPRDRTTVDNDAYVGLASAIGPGPGVVVVGGTGFTAKGISQDGHRVVLPWYVAERGAGHIIGRLAAKAALFDLLGVSQPTTMTLKVMKRLGLDTALELERWLAVSRPSWELGQLTPDVTEAAREGDEPARSLLRTAGLEFGLAAVFIAREAGLRQCRVAIIGGVFHAKELVTDPMQEALAASGIEADLVPAMMPPVGGAVILGWARSAHQISEDMIKTLSDEVSRVCS